MIGLGLVCSLLAFPVKSYCPLPPSGGTLLNPHPTDSVFTATVVCSLRLSIREWRSTRRLFYPRVLWFGRHHCFTLFSIVSGDGTHLNRYFSTIGEHRNNSTCFQRWRPCRTVSPGIKKNIREGQHLPCLATVIKSKILHNKQRQPVMYAFLPIIRDPDAPPRRMKSLMFCPGRWGKVCCVASPAFEQNICRKAGKPPKADRAANQRRIVIC